MKKHSAGLRRSGQLPLLLSDYHGRHSNAHKIQPDHRRHKNQHGHGVRRRRNDCGHDRDNQNRVADVFPEKLGRDNSEQRQKENQNGQLEHQTQPEKHHQRQIEVFVHRDHRNDRPLGTHPERNQELEDIGQCNEVSEGDSAQKEKHGGKKKTCDRAALVFIERWSHEEPYLVQHHGRSQHKADVDSQRDDEIKKSRGMRCYQLGIKVRIGERLQHGLGYKTDYVLTDVNAHKRANGNCNQRIDDPLAQLDQVLKERHLPAGLGSLFGVLASRHFEVFRISFRSQLSAFCNFACSSCGAAASGPSPPPCAFGAFGALVSFSRETFPSATGATTGPSLAPDSGTEASVAPAAANSGVPACVSAPEGVASVAGCVCAAAAADAASALRRSTSRACRSRSRISSSKAALKSVEALRNSAISLPSPRASSGSLCGPNTTSTITNTTIMCGMLSMVSDPITLRWHHRERRSEVSNVSIRCAIILKSAGHARVG